jgi:FkbM family methyltransferase
MGSSANPAKFLFWKAQALARAAGFAITPLRDVERRIIGLELRATNRSTGNITGEIVTWTHDGQTVSLFVANEVDLIQSEHRRGRFYEPEELKIIAEYFKGGVFLDVGANVGNHSVYALKFLGAQRVVAIEPNPDAYNILRVNIALNDLSGRFVHHAVGLSDGERRAGIICNQDNLGWTALDESDASGGLRVVTGDSLVGDETISFVKIDVEGMEIAVLRGLEQTVNRFRPPIFIEICDPHLAQLVEWAGRHGYQSVSEYSRYPGMANHMLVPDRP